MFEDRLGGDIRTQIQRKRAQLISKNNDVTYFNRNIGVPTYTFEGTQVSTFSELTYTRESKNRMGGWSQLMDRQI